MRAALILSALVVGCSRPPAATVEVRHLDGPRPPEWAARCRADGLAPPIAYQWKLAPTVRAVGWNPPLDQPALLVEIPHPDPRVAAWVECTVVGADRAQARGAASLNPPSVSAAPATAKPGELVTVRGSGFGVARNADDALWWVPAWGAARVADHACKGAAWSDAAVSACAPSTLGAGEWQLRVQASGSLALAPAPLKVTR